MTVAPSLAAQSAQKYAVQLAALSTSIGVTGGSDIAGIGFEPQLRFNRAYIADKFTLSVGLGGQYTTHSAGGDRMSISGVFLEPRLVPAWGTERLAPYLSARFALLRQSSNFGSSSGGSGFGAGAGLAVVLSPTVNLDMGVALVRQQFGNFYYTEQSLGAGAFDPFFTYAAKIGFSIGFPREN